MTIKDILARIAEINAVADDNERAHSLADDLWEDVLRAIAAGTLGCDPREACNVALTAIDNICRWYA